MKILSRQIVLALATCSTLLVFAQSTIPSSTFVYSGDFTGSSNLTFAVNLAQDSQDMFIYLSGPSSASWLAIGTGSEMRDSLIFIVYSSTDDKNLTLSPRIASNNAEPTYDPSLALTLFPGTGIMNDSYVVKAQCSNCRSWTGGSLNIANNSAFIYAVGPDGSIQSDDKAADMRRHTHYGRFTMDLTQATGSGGVPADTTSNSGAAAVGSPRTDSDWGLIGHLVLMVLAFVVLFPVGYLLLRYFDSVKYHWYMQTAAALVTLVGVAIGVYESRQYNKSKSYTSGHQIIGIIIFLVLIVQWSFGYIHHKQYPQKRRRTWITYGHLVLGPSILLVGAANGFIGFNFADSTKIMIWYGIALAVVGTTVVVMMVQKKIHIRKKAAFMRPPPQDFGDAGYEGGFASDIALTGHAGEREGHVHL